MSEINKGIPETVTQQAKVIDFEAARGRRYPLSVDCHVIGYWDKGESQMAGGLRFRSFGACWRDGHVGSLVSYRQLSQGKTRHRAINLILKALNTLGVHLTSCANDR